VELPKIPSIVGLQVPSRRRKTFRWLKGLGCKLVELLGVVGSKGKSSMVVDGLASSLIWSQGGDCCESDSKLEKLKSGSCQHRSTIWKIAVRFLDQVWQFHSGKIVVRCGKSYNDGTLMHKIKTYFSA
jgi:hypothetical protein